MNTRQKRTCPVPGSGQCGSIALKTPLGQVAHSPSAGGELESSSLVCSEQRGLRPGSSIHHLVTQRRSQSHLDVAPHQLALIHLKGTCLRFISQEKERAIGRRRSQRGMLNVIAPMEEVRPQTTAFTSWGGAPCRGGGKQRWGRSLQLLRQAER